MAKTNTKSKTDWNDQSEALKSAAHQERLAILHLMCNCGCYQIMVKTIYETLDLEQSITPFRYYEKWWIIKKRNKEWETLYYFNRDNEIAQSMKKLLSKKSSHGQMHKTVDSFCW